MPRPGYRRGCGTPSLSGAGRQVFVRGASLARGTGCPNIMRATFICIVMLQVVLSAWMTLPALSLVTLSEPTGNSVVEIGAPLVIAATADSIETPIVLMEVLIGDRVIASAVGAEQIESSWTPMIPDTYRLTVRSTESEGLVSTRTTLIFAGLPASPRGVTDGLQVWLRPGIGLTVGFDDDVASWLDQSGNGHDATQGLAGSRPTYLREGFGREPALRLEGSHCLSSDTGFPTGDYTKIVQFRLAAFTGGDQIYSSAEPATGAHMLSLGGTPHLNVSHAGLLVSSSEQIELDEARVACATYDLAKDEGELFLDGVKTGTGSGAGPNVSTSYQVGGYASLNHMDGTIGEILVYDRVLSPAEIASVSAYLTDRYPPVITVPDAGPLTHEAGTPFVDPGATATDAVDGTVVLVSSTRVDGATPGTYTLTYGYTDAAGNAATPVEVTVKVEDSTLKTIRVNTNSDQFDTPSGSTVSLREAIRDANASANNERIVLPTGTYWLSRTGSGENSGESGDLDILPAASSGSIVIEPPSRAGRTVINGKAIGGFGEPIFHLRPGAVLTLRMLTVEDADGGMGGAILNEGGQLSLSRCALADNRAESGSAIYSLGADAEVALERSTLAGNWTATGSPGSGGAIHNEGGRLSLVGCTLASNAARFGGAISIHGDSPVVTLVNCTISRNSAAMGGGIHDASLAGTLEMENTIVADNRIDVGGQGPDIAMLGGGTIVASGGNLVGNNETVDALFVSAGDPMLQGLALRGGLTRTMPPEAGSPAIDAGVTFGTTPRYDQRDLVVGVDGDSSPDSDGEELDIGAVERLAGAKLAGLDLRSLNFNRVDLTGTDFTGADLADTWFYESEADTADFTDANLSEATFMQTSLDHAVFAGADATDARFRDADLTGADFTNAILVDGEFVRNVTSGAVFAGADLSGARMAVEDLVGVDFSNAILVGTNFAEADLEGAVLRGVDATDANFEKADLRDTDLEGARLPGTRLVRADLDGAVVTNAEFAETEFRRVHGINLVGQPMILPAGWQVISGNLVGPSANLWGGDLSWLDLSGADLSGAILGNANLEGAQLGNTVLDRVRSGGIAGVPATLPVDWGITAGYLVGPGVDLSQASVIGGELSGRNLTGADLTEAVLVDSDLTGVTFTNAVLFKAYLLRTEISGADLSGADLTSLGSHGVTGTPAVLPDNWQLVAGFLLGPGVDLSGAMMSGINLSGMHLWGARFSRADLSGADLSGSDLTGAHFRYAKLEGCDFSGGILTEASLEQTTLTGSNFTGAVGVKASLAFSHLGDVNFSQADFSQAIFVFANMEGAMLQDAVLVGANLSHANLADADGTRAGLAAANFAGATISSIDLSGATLTDVVSGGMLGEPALLPSGWGFANGYFLGGGSDLAGLDFSGLDLSGIDLGGADLTDVDFTDTNLTGTTLDGALLAGADFSGANLSGSTGLATVPFGGDPPSIDLFTELPGGFDPAAEGWRLFLNPPPHLTISPDPGAPGDAVITFSSGPYGSYRVQTSIDLHGWTDVHPTWVPGDGGILSIGHPGGSLDAVRYWRLEVTRPVALFEGWGLVNGYLLGPGADAVGADLAGADLSGLDLSSANLSGADLSLTILSGANFSSANLAGVAGLATSSFQGDPPMVDLATILPDGFDPLAAGWRSILSPIPLFTVDQDASDSSKVVITFLSAPHGLYTVESSSDMIHWSPLTPVPVAGDGGILSFEDPGAFVHAHLYWRIGVSRH